MSQKLLFKIGYYSVYEEQTLKGKKYVADSGKTIYLERFKKYIINKNRDVKEFKTLEKLKEYVKKKLTKKTKEKQKKLDKLPKSLYLVLIKEEKSGNTFVKVGITSKRFIMRRFSKAYGYEGYILETILRRIDTPDAEKLEERINTCATIIKTSLDPIDALATAWRESNFLDVVDHTNTSYGPMQFIKALWCDEKTWGIVDCDHLKRGIWVHNFHFQKYKNERTRFCAYIGAKDCSSNKIHIKWHEHLRRKKAIKKLYVFKHD